MNPQLDFTGQPACRSVDPEVFFPVSGWHAEGVSEAKAVCARCPVRAECLRWAVEHGEHGIWGGTTEAERDRARRAGRDLTPVSDAAAAA